MTGTQEERKVHGQWKKGQTSPKDYRDVMKLYRENSRKAESQLDLNLGTAVKDNQKCFCKHINEKKRPMMSLHSLLHAGGNTVAKDEE